MAVAKIINLRGAGKGTDGATVLAGARRFTLIGNVDSKIEIGGAGEMPTGAHKTGAAPQIVTEHEGLLEPLNAIKGLLANQTLKLHYRASTGNRVSTVTKVSATAIGEYEFPPAEGQGNVPRCTITWDIHCDGVDVDTLAEALTDAVDAGSPPTETVNALVHLMAAHRGATGVTAIASAVRARLRARCQKRVARTGGAELPECVWLTHVAAEIAIEIEDFTDVLAALTGAATGETLKLNYRSSSSSAAVLTVKWATLIGTGQVQGLGAEQGGRVPPTELAFAITMGTGVTTVAQALVIT